MLHGLLAPSSVMIYTAGMANAAWRDARAILLLLGPFTVAMGCERDGAPSGVPPGEAGTGDGSLPGEPAAVDETLFRAAQPSGYCAPTPSSACSLDLVDWKIPPDGMLVRRDASLRLLGWAADGANETVPAIVVLELHGSPSYYLTVDRLTKRPDVAAVTQIPDFADAGFDAQASFREVQPGRYRLRVLQWTRSGTVLACGTGRTFVVE